MNDRRKKNLGIRTCLLVGVNVPLILASAVFLALDYHNMLVNRIADKRVALDEEARVLLSAIDVSAGDTGHVQQLIDLACGRMQDAASPGHHIAVQLETQILQAKTHHRASVEYFNAIRRAASQKDRQASFEGEMIVVGMAGENARIVYVSEFVANVVQSIRLQLLMRLTGGVAVTLMILVVINLILARIVIAPLQRISATVRRIGGGELGAGVEAVPSRELQLVAEAINDMSRTLADIERRREAQMHKARKIQQNLQPTHADMPGLSLAYICHSADDVGGDFLDFAQTDDGIVVTCVADVTGHGVPAAMGAAMLKVLFDAATEHTADPGDILRSMNAAFHRVALEGDFATVAALAISPDRSTMHYASAGHEPVVLLRAGGEVELLDSTGLILGVDPQAECSIRAMTLTAGDRIVIYTDGLVEAVSSSNEQFGRDRLVQLLVEHVHEPVQAFCNAVINGVNAFAAEGEQRDDMTVLVIERPQ